MHICISLQGEGEGRAHFGAGEEGSHPLPTAAGGLTLGTHLPETHTHLAPTAPGWKVLLSQKVLVGQINNHKSICLKIIFRGFVVCLSFFKPALPLCFSHSPTKIQEAFLISWIKCKGPEQQKARITAAGFSLI